MPVFYRLNERWQQTPPIVYGGSERRPLWRKFMKTSSTLMYQGRGGPEYEGDEHTCTWAYDGGGPL